MDFTSGLEEIAAVTYDEPPPKHLGERFWK